MRMRLWWVVCLVGGQVMVAAVSAPGFLWNTAGWQRLEAGWARLADGLDGGVGFRLAFTTGGLLIGSGTVLAGLGAALRRPDRGDAATASPSPSP